MTGPITALYASLISLLLIFLSSRIAINRRKKRIGIGDKGDTDMARMVRVQANLVEYAPIALLLLFFCETNGMDSRLVHTAGFALLLARIAHAYGLNKSIGVSMGRFWGTLVTWSLIVILALVNIGQYFF